MENVERRRFGHRHDYSSHSLFAQRVQRSNFGQNGPEEIFYNNGRIEFITVRRSSCNTFATANLFRLIENVEYSVSKRETSVVQIARVFLIMFFKHRWRGRHIETRNFFITLKWTWSLICNVRGICIIRNRVGNIYSPPLRI